LHDGVTAERLGIPAMAVMTTRFVSAAELMARVLGFPGYRFAVIAHPISSAGDDALRDMAAVAADQARELLLGEVQRADPIGLNDPGRDPPTR
jgi:hypothetical protein